MSSPDRLLQLLDEAMALPQAARGDFLAKECQGDPKLLAKIQALIEEDSSSAEWDLERPRELMSPLLSATQFPLLGERIGPWKLVQVLGEGGMGTVYLGERVDEAFSRQVAIKVIRNDAKRKPMLERFGQEQHIHAGLDHPSIAALLDAGRTEEDSPYFVMEYVPGERIDDYCENKDLDARRRIELFVELSHAVHDTHSLGIIHRDLKPSNIMVQPSGKVKLLDFGVALVLGGGQEQAEGELPFITPSYASPESLQRQSITRASDQYSLGIILQELLTDRRPEVSDSSDTTTQHGSPNLELSKLRRGSLARLSENSRVLRDLKAILARALAPEPKERYASVLDFAQDLQRLLDGELVRARPSSRWETWQRRVSVYRWPLVGVCLLSALLISSLVYTQHKAGEYEDALQQSESSKERATQHAVSMERFAKRVMIALLDRLRVAPESQAMREKLLSIGTEFFDSEPNRHLLSQELLATIISSHHQLALLYTNPFELSATQTGKARQAFEKAHSMIPILRSINPNWADSHLAIILFSWGGIDTQHGYLAQGRQRLETSLRILSQTEKLLAVHRSPERFLQCQSLLVRNLIDSGDHEAARELLLKLDAGIQEQSGANSTLDDFGRGILHLLTTDTASFWVELGDHKKALSIYRLIQENPWQHPGSVPTAQISNMVGQTNRIWLEWKLKEAWSEERVLEHIQELIQALHHQDLEKARFHPGLGELLFLQAQVLDATGRWPEAKAAFQESFRVWRYAVRMDPQNESAKLDLVEAMRFYIASALEQDVTLATLQTLIEEARAHLATLDRKGVDHPSVKQGIAELDAYF